QCFSEQHIKTWNPIMPRLHLAYDVSGDGKTVIKGGWGRFSNMHTQEDLNPLNPNASLAATFKWQDLNTNKRWDVGESLLDFNGKDFVQLQNLGASALTTQVGLTDNPNLKQRGADEYSVSLEREIIRDFSIRVTGLYVSEYNTLRLFNTLRPYN